LYLPPLYLGSQPSANRIFNSFQQELRIRVFVPTRISMQNPEQCKSVQCNHPCQEYCCIRLAGRVCIFLIHQIDTHFHILPRQRIENLQSVQYILKSTTSGKAAYRELVPNLTSNSKSQPLPLSITFSISPAGQKILRRKRKKDCVRKSKHLERRQGQSGARQGKF
jgi:hypothetical protein